MARLSGSNRKYQQARKTVEHLYDAEVMIDAAFLDAIQTMITLCNDPKCAVATRMAASKFIIETHGKFAKAHGKDPIPKDFIDRSSIVRDEEVVEESIIQMEFIG